MRHYKGSASVKDKTRNMLVAGYWHESTIFIPSSCVNVSIIFRISDQASSESDWWHCGEHRPSQEIHVLESTE